MPKFQLLPRRWYACEIIGDEFDDHVGYSSTDRCSYSPIKVYDLTDRKGSREFTLSFYHAYYPEGVRDKQYRLKVKAWQNTFLFAGTEHKSPKRFVMIYDISMRWMLNHFSDYMNSVDRTVRESNPDIQDWLERTHRQGKL